jgi:hypothetical protein
MHAKPESLFWKIKSALDDEDIEGLLAIGCPSDEYGSEATLIEDGLCRLTDSGKRPADIDEAARIVEQIWNLKFGPFETSEADQRRPHYEAIAKKITG